MASEALVWDDVQDAALAALSTSRMGVAPPAAYPPCPRSQRRAGGDPQLTEPIVAPRHLGQNSTRSRFQGITHDAVAFTGRRPTHMR
jgi:hypothetical protein